MDGENSAPMGTMPSFLTRLSTPLCGGEKNEGRQMNILSNMSIIINHPNIEIREAEQGGRGVGGKEKK